MGRLSYQYIYKYFLDDGILLLTEHYENNIQKLEVRCNEGHIYHPSFGNFISNHRCPKCISIKCASKPEKEVLNYVKSITNETVIDNDRTQIINPKTGHNLELDVWIPSLKKAIEFNGMYWHSLPYQKIKDGIKKTQCRNKGIDLMIVNEQDWVIDKKTCLNKVREFIIDEKIFGR